MHKRVFKGDLTKAVVLGSMSKEVIKTGLFLFSFFSFCVVLVSVNIRLLYNLST
jgi:hypothetical protein